MSSVEQFTEMKGKTDELLKEAGIRINNYILQDSDVPIEEGWREYLEQEQQRMREGLQGPSQSWKGRLNRPIRALLGSDALIGLTYVVKGQGQEIPVKHSTGLILPDYIDPENRRYTQVASIGTCYLAGPQSIVTQEKSELDPRSEFFRPGWAGINLRPLHDAVTGVHNNHHGEAEGQPLGGLQSHLDPFIDLQHAQANAVPGLIQAQQRSQQEMGNLRGFSHVGHHNETAIGSVIATSHHPLDEELRPPTVSILRYDDQGRLQEQIFWNGSQVVQASPGQGVIAYATLTPQLVGLAELEVGTIRPHTLESLRVPQGMGTTMKLMGMDEWAHERVIKTVQDL